MKALISPNENNRICQVQEVEFEISSPLFWVDCPDNCNTFWKYENNTFIEVNPNEITIEQCKTQASYLLQQTDWAEIPSVIDTNNNPHLLNYQEFIDYRVAVRQFIINPVVNPTFPTEPKANWSN